MALTPGMEARNEASDPEPVASSRWALAALCLSMLLASFGTSVANVGLPTFAEVFDASFHEVQWIVLAYLLTITTVIVGVGRLGDIAGRRFLLLAGLFIFTAGSAMCGLAPSLWLLVAARAVQGLGAAIMMTLAMALIAGTVARAKTGTAIGLLGTMSAIGTALGPSLGGVLIHGFGWRAIFLVTVAPGLLTFLLAHLYVAADRPAPKGAGSGFDALGSLLLALTLGSYALAMTIGRGRFGMLNAALLVAAALALLLFVRAEARAEAPLVRLAMFRDSRLGAGCAMSALVSTVMMATLVVGPFYLSGALGLDAARVGVAMAAGPIAAALAGWPSGHLVDRFGVRRTALFGLVAIAGGSLLLSALPATVGVPGYLAPILVVTVGYALFQTANNSAVMLNVGAEQRGVVSGMLNLSRNLGLITGASAMGALFAAASGTLDHAAEPGEIAAGMRTAFAVAAALTAAAIGIALAARAAERRLTTPAPV
jgi:EmrB/QacA subfamily drug resistance transporter